MKSTSLPELFCEVVEVSIPGVILSSGAGEGMVDPDKLAASEGNSTGTQHASVPKHSRGREKVPNHTKLASFILSYHINSEEIHP